ncbi:MAG: hypothetical protein WCL02_05055 [bacterium]
MYPVYRVPYPVVMFPVRRNPVKENVGQQNNVPLKLPFPTYGYMPEAQVAYNIAPVYVVKIEFRLKYTSKGFIHHSKLLHDHLVVNVQVFGDIGFHDKSFPLTVTHIGT